jgi:cyclic dehypoxanthinyl futalosine synthase
LGAREFRGPKRSSFTAGPWRNWVHWPDARRNLAKEKSYDGRGREIVTYIVDRNINYTNVCNVYCKFCAFYRTEKDEDHYVLTHEQFDQKLDELTAAGGVQILMQGGHHPKLGFDWYLELLHHIREKYPHINIHGFSRQSSSISPRPSACHCAK